MQGFSRHQIKTGDAMAVKQKYYIYTAAAAGGTGAGALSVVALGSKKYG